MSAAPIVILGIGNLLMGDDGLGVRVIEALQSRDDLPPGVDLVDGGTGGPTLMVHFEGARALIVIDAVNLNAAPGTVRAFGLEDIEGDAAPMRFSLHELGVMPMLDLARRLDGLPPTVRIIGVQPERFDIGDALTPAVAAAVPRVVELVMEEVRKLS